MNNCSFIGRLTKDIELRVAGSTLATNFSIAIDRPGKNGGERQADFPRITVFGKQAENCKKYLKKGNLVGVTCRVQTNNYQNKDGVTVYTTDFIAEKVEFLEWGDKHSEATSDSNAVMPQQAVPQAMPQQTVPQAIPQQTVPQAIPQQAVPQAMPQQAAQAMPQQTVEENIEDDIFDTCF